MIKKNSIIILVLSFSLFSCKEEIYVPKQKGYSRIDLPQHLYKRMEGERPYSFEISTSSIIKIDSSKLAEPYWININYPTLNATVQITYKALLNDKKRYASILHNSIKLTNKHQVKAYSIEEMQGKRRDGRTFFVYELQGEVPSPFQFYQTDTTNHFIRGALYFDTSTKNDSLAPIIEYIKTDIIQMMNTLEWKNKKI